MYNNNINLKFLLRTYLKWYILLPPTAFRHSLNNLSVYLVTDVFPFLVTNVIKLIITFVLSKITIMNRRLQYLLELEGLTQAQFADRIGVGRASISHILNGRNKPGYEIISSILKKFPSINPDWLILGQGKPYRNQSETEHKTQPTLFNDVENTNIQDIKVDFTETEPRENEIKQRQSSSVQRKIKRITVYFDDNTFEEYYGK